MIELLASSDAQVVQLTTAQGLLGVGAVILAIGVAWGTLKTSVGNISDNLENVKDDLKDVKKEIKKLNASIATHTTDIVALQVHTKYGRSNSPIKPNPQGQKLLKDSGFNAQYPKLKDELFKTMDEMELRTLYDYEKGALEALAKLKDDPLMDPLKEFAVNNPDVPLDDILLVGSWVVRDDYAAYKQA